MHTNQTAFLAALACASLACAPSLAAPEGGGPEGVAPLIAPPRPATLVEGPLSAFAPLLGTWEIHGAWLDGRPIHGRNTYAVGIGGRFIEAHSVTLDDAGRAYERYHTIMAPNAQTGGADAHAFTYDGSVGRTPLVPVEGAATPTYEAEWSAGGTPLRQVITVAPDGSTYSWKVWVQLAGSADWSPIMDGVWHHVNEESAVTDASGARPIEPSLFVSSGADVRSFVKTAEVEAGAHEVFNAWATREGWASVYTNEGNDAAIELAIGGAYEWYFYDKVGSNGCQVLSYIPDRMISFTWNAPPNQPVTRELRTWVVVELEPVGPSRTRITLTHLGFGQGPEWDETYAYFDAAWPRVLAAMGAKFKPQG